MSEVQDASFAIKAAEEAAAAGDFPTAEQYLSRAVELEELSSGPMHAELASILNNLGVVYERLDRPDKAEACYRRAYAIAQASLPPGDPGIELSATNLREFCAARGIPFESASAHSATADRPASAHGAMDDTPASADGAIADKPAAKFSPAWPPSSLRRVEEPVAAVPKKAPAEPERLRDAEPVVTPASAALMPPRTLAIAALVVVAAIVGVIFVATRSSPPNSAPAPAAAPTPTAAAPVQVAPAPVVRTPESAPAPQATARTAAPSSPPAAARPKAAPAAPPVARRESSTASAVVPTLVSAQLCRSIQTAGEWRCTPANGEVAPGTVVFYTRLKAPADTAVEHRWYRGDRLQQKMTLRIRANPGAGYRTYSRATVGAGLTGAWKVELRAMNGTVLHEEHFTVGP
jgi:hypothetical protein